MNAITRSLAALAVFPFIVGAKHPDVTTAQEAIKAQEGCFRVTFQYQEVEGHQPDYTLAEPKKSEVIELVTVEDEQADSIVLQHILVTPPRIKHWKQIWVYEKTEFDVYSGVNQWAVKTLSPEDVAGEWTQIVRGVADNPRYGCSAEWSLEDETAWSCQTWAPKPRRDQDREDYNILDRRNTHRIHTKGWVHEQRNTKIQVDASGVTRIVTEQGNNTYDRIDDSECAEAAEWWAKRKTTWDQVQRAWDDVSAGYSGYTVTPKKGLLPLWLELFWLARRPLPEKKHPKIYGKAARLIDRHVVSSGDIAMPPEEAGGH